MRRVIIAVFLIAFLIAIASAISVPQIVLRTMLLNAKLTLIFSAIAGFCGVLLAYFVYVDGKAIENLTTLTIRICKATNVDQSTDNWKYDSLIGTYNERRVINPAGVVADKIYEKMKLGKTREEAIAELYSEEMKNEK